MSVAYFPGCSLHATAREYEVSTHLICESLGVRLREVQDWNCCGATAGHSINRGVMMGLNRRNLSQVIKMGLDRLLTPCSGCFNRLKSASIEFTAGTGTGLINKEQNNQLHAEKLQAVPRVFHLLQFLVEEVGFDRLAKPIKIPLKGLRLAAYYGCLTTRPHRIAQFDDPEQPEAMDRIMRVLQADTVSWSHKAECCGGPFAAAETAIVTDCTQEVVDAARAAGAEALVVACPMCQLNLDTRQMNTGNGGVLPIIYFTQLIALAYGYTSTRAGLRRLVVNPIPLLKSKGLT